jgi:hypothetical protein
MSSFKAAIEEHRSPASTKLLQGDVFYDKTTTSFLRLILQPSQRPNDAVGLWLVVVSLPTDLEVLYLKSAHLKVYNADGQAVLFEKDLSLGPGVPASLEEHVWGWKDLWQGSGVDSIPVSSEEIPHGLQIDH